MKIVNAAVNENGKVTRQLIIIEDRVCKRCGAIFTPKRRASKYCSLICSARDRNHFQGGLENQKCVICDSEFRPYRSNSKTCSKKCANVLSSRNSYKRKDIIRHGGKREELIDKHGSVCSRCGKECEPGRIHAHHFTLDKADHENQALLCLSCHGNSHAAIFEKKRKFISKENIIEAVAKAWSLDEACNSLGISRSFLYKKRKEYGLPSRTVLRGRKRK